MIIEEFPLLSKNVDQTLVGGLGREEKEDQSKVADGICQTRESLESRDFGDEDGIRQMFDFLSNTRKKGERIDDTIFVRIDNQLRAKVQLSLNLNYRIGMSYDGRIYITFEYTPPKTSEECSQIISAFLLSKDVQYDQSAASRRGGFDDGMMVNFYIEPNEFKKLLY